MKYSCYYHFLKAAAFLAPLYFLYYSPLYEKPEDPRIKTLWLFISLGFGTYLLLAIILFII